ncbi:molybdopterin-containing oxidoreductase II, DMSO/TMAO/BSO reductase family, monoheme c-type cytochrome [Campylobacter blaseri]|uniref:Cytochrome C n=1 Tax=Campylobacter blaseri TaxID=2042961 RepID=A0A2P8R126_9BACT|nr:hypothetical protein [Campylobacter blaseri]PSM52189.1 hypothetical protein CQ405_03810 [Campylobacter blaseri]PSM53955.1 hypothetical protein CRN67_03810 [Campylobacter blaseri]QKF85392.1 molybdopterin-containing oxidoreductase II, DMSO/TMAO/BSO reductase family, monoheme c-type cytochrome [Campylobacter blaseri]
MKKKILVLSLLCSSYLFGGDIVYSDVVKSLYETPKGEKVVGRLLPTAPVEILNKEGDFLQVKIKGYVQNGKEQALYFTKGKRILNAAFRKNSNVRREMIKDDKEWAEVSVITYVKNENFHKDLESMMQRANELFTANCSTCHQLHGINEYNANQWPSVFKSMVDRTAIDKKDRFLVTQFLQKTTKKD